MFKKIKRSGWMVIKNKNPAAKINETRRMQAIFNVERVESNVTLDRGNNVANNENSAESVDRLTLYTF